MYYLEYCYERNEELEKGCEYAYYVLHYAGMRDKNPYCDDHVYDGEYYVVLKVNKL